MSTTLSSRSNIQLIHALQEARVRTLELVDDLNDEQMIDPRLAIVNQYLVKLLEPAREQKAWEDC
jgi:hypothetical protein